MNKLYNYVGVPAVPTGFVTPGLEVSWIHHPSAIGSGTSHHRVTVQRTKLRENLWNYDIFTIKQTQ